MKNELPFTEETLRESGGDPLLACLNQTRKELVTAAREDRKKRDEKAAKKTAEKAL